MNGTQLIAEERERQINEEGWTPAHDAQWKAQELGFAARCYLDKGVNLIPRLYDPSPFWPWDNAWWKPSKDPVRNLVKAGALIAAEIDRLQRLPGSNCPLCKQATLVQRNGRNVCATENCGWCEWCNDKCGIHTTGGCKGPQGQEGEPAQPRVVCLCGSTRFRDEFTEANRRETMAGNIVLAPGVFAHSGDPLTDEDKRRLDELHLRKIDHADSVLVINPNGYIGDSTRREIEYARSKGKPVSFTHNIMICDDPS